MASLFSREIAEYAVLIFRLLSISRISNFEGFGIVFARTSFQPLYPITFIVGSMSSDPTTQTLVN